MPPNTLTGEAMEAAVKHTYLCGSSEWHSEGTRISIAPHPFARGAMRASHRCCERVEEAGAVYSVEGVAKFSLIHGGEGAAKAAAFADARMQMVAEYWAQQFNRRSGNDAKLSFVVAQVTPSLCVGSCSFVVSSGLCGQPSLCADAGCGPAPSWWVYAGMVHFLLTGVCPGDAFAFAYKRVRRVLLGSEGARAADEAWDVALGELGAAALG